MIKRLSLIAALVATLGMSVASATDITGAGSSFVNPIFSKWAGDYNKATGHKLNYQSIGSGAGIKQIDAKTVDFGASDMPLTDEDLVKKNQTQFPAVIGGVIPVVNIAGQRIGDGRPGPIYTRIRAAYQAFVARTIQTAVVV